MSRLARTLPAIILLMFLTGCASTRPGKLSDVRAVSERQRVGNVYLLRGFIGIFSNGIDQLTETLNEHGVRARVYQDDQWRRLAATLVNTYKDAPHPEPLVLVGHSYGADDMIRVARELEKERITVDLLVTLDPVTPPAVPGNVRMAHNIYRSNGVWDTLPWLRGVPVSASEQFNGTLANHDIRVNRTDLLDGNTDHFNIEKKPKIHREIVTQVLTVCPMRQQ